MWLAKASAIELLLIFAWVFIFAMDLFAKSKHAWFSGVMLGVMCLATWAHGKATPRDAS